MGTALYTSVMMMGKYMRWTARKARSSGRTSFAVYEVPSRRIDGVEARAPPARHRRDSRVDPHRIHTQDFGDKVRGEPAVASGRLYVATINSDTFLHCIGGSGSSHHSSSSKNKDEDEGSSFGTVVTWLAVLIGLGVVAYAALTIGKPYLEEHGFRLPVVQRRDAFAPAPVDDGTYAAPFVELQESMIDDKPTGAVI